MLWLQLEMKQLYLFGRPTWILAHLLDAAIAPLTMVILEIEFEINSSWSIYWETPSSNYRDTTVVLRWFSCLDILNITPIPWSFFNIWPGPWQWYATKWIIYQWESESGFGQIADFGFLEIWPIFQVKWPKIALKWLKFFGGPHIW